MTILHVLGSPGDGGAETYFVDLVTSLHLEDGDQAAAIRPHPRRETTLAEAGVPLATAPFGGPLDLRTSRRLKRLVREEAPRVAVAWMNRAARFTPAGLPRVGRLGGYYDLKYYAGFDHLVANTGDIADWIVREGWARERVSVIPNFAEAEADAAPAPRAAEDTPQDAPLLLAMSRLHPAKGLDVLLRALVRLPDAWLWIAGSGPLEAELKALADTLGVAGRVRFLGWRADSSALYRAADVTVFPSRFEPLGNTVIQAWAHGAPVVAAAARGPSDLITEGEDGLLAPVEDDAALAAAVRRVLDEPGLRMRLAGAGRARAAQGFSRAAVLAQVARAVRPAGARLMCGIAGVIGPLERAPQSLDEARRMVAMLAHRGPDGVRVEAVGGAALAHARLSIIDLEGGWQPLHAAGSTVIGNGEIYNYLELIEEFGLKDRLSTGSDFEPLLHLYAQEGERAFARLRGMYAFCLIGADGRTWLVRDPFGIKPLYAWPSEQTLAFASERRSLPLEPSVEPTQVLTLGYSVEDAGLNVPPHVAPGAVLQWVGGELEARAGLPALPTRPVLREGSGERDWLTRLDAVLEDSVRVHQRADVPYGLFLSGGIDSAAIATLMARLDSRPVTAFTCGFDAPGAADERAGAERVARALDLDWRETAFNADDFHRIAPEVAWALDDPTTDYACLPTWKLAEAAKGTLTVVLSGEGGDELFAGYGRYRRALRPALLGGRPAEPQVDARFLKDGGRGALERWRAAAHVDRSTGLTPLQQAQWDDIATWLPNDLLLKLDRMLMAHGLEGRTPFLDREVAAFAWSLPDRLKVRGRYGKWILRKWLERACPAAQPWARKRGFTVPVADWIAPDAAATGARVAACEGVAEVCDLDAVRAAFADPAQRKSWWPLVFYALWWTIQVGGASRDEAREAVLGR